MSQVAPIAAEASERAGSARGAYQRRSPSCSRTGSRSAITARFANSTPMLNPASAGQFAPALPKTRSGKIMRRLLRDISEERKLGDVTTLANADVVDSIRDRALHAPTED